ncbi:adenylyltransferase/cytidyltransferase family protein [bacterium]|nr:adenylyltransferase/cytidyltransferase family protein [bacterium]HPF35027.1 adenylyltransferase/cytidyltransferase family protein [Candidatus Krumholzibacteria bacterium]
MTGIAPLIPREELAAWAEAQHAAGRRIVFTNGCFDLIHRGHVEYLADAAALGDVLIVALNTDASVRRLKGPSRPIVSQDDRCAVLAHLRPVGALTMFDEPTPLETIALIRPHVLVKGDEYAESQIVGADLVRADGGEVVRVAMRPGRSTSSIIESIKHLP